MSETVVDTYTNYLGAEVVSDCPECEHSHFLTDVILDEQGNGEYICGDEVVEIHHRI